MGQKREDLLRQRRQGQSRPARAGSQVERGRPMSVTIGEVAQVAIAVILAVALFAGWG
jgi:hypothetical protein